jgi:hypothetical protein
MDFFLWGHIKAMIYISPADFEEDLIARIVKAAATRHFLSHMSVSAAWSAVYPVCGQKFEHLPYVGMKYNFFQNTSVVLLNI